MKSLRKRFSRGTRFLETVFLLSHSDDVTLVHVAHSRRDEPFLSAGPQPGSRDLVLHCCAAKYTVSYNVD